MMTFEEARAVLLEAEGDADLQHVFPFMGAKFEKDTPEYKEKVELLGIWERLDPQWRERIHEELDIPEPDDLETLSLGQLRELYELYSESYLSTDNLHDEFGSQLVTEALEFIELNTDVSGSYLLKAECDKIRKFLKEDVYTDPEEFIRRYVMEANFTQYHNEAINNIEVYIKWGDWAYEVCGNYVNDGSESYYFPPQ